MRAATLVLGGLALVLVCWLGRPFPPDLTDLAQANLSIGAPHLLGTDPLGRDVLSRIMAGALDAILLLALVSAISLGLGLLVGLAAALGSRWQSVAIQRIADFFLVMPSLVIALVLTAVLGLSPVSAAIALGIGGWAPYAFLVLHRAREIEAHDFVRAARALGVAPVALAARHLLPNLLPSVLAYHANQLGHILLNYAALGFLGLGSNVSRSDWGAMVYEYRTFLFERPALIAWPALAIFTSCLALNLLIDAPSRRR